MVSCAKKKRRRRHDRLSDLQDDILGHVLSFLPTEEAGRAAVLSRRWRRVFDFVQTISFQPVEPPAENSILVDRVSNALIARRRCDGGAPLRCLRVAMRGYTAPDCYAVDQWLSYACSHGVQELRLETATHEHAYPSAIAPCCYDRYTNSYGNNGSDNSDGYDDSDSYDSDDSDGNDGYDDSDGYADSDYSDYSDYQSSSDYESDSDIVTSDGITGVPQYAAPTRIQYDVSLEIFSCATMRALHLVSCSLPPSQLPSTIHLPSLETLSFTNIMYTSRQISGENMQRVISCCPRLADLTLEACGQITDVTVLDKKRLTSFALRCCHSVRRVTIDASPTLRVFDYRGDASSCFTLVGDAPRIASAKIHLCCGMPSGKTIDYERLRGLLHLLANATHLDLGWPDVTDYAVLSSDAYDDFHTLHFPQLQNLTRLELGSRCTGPRVLDRVARVLRQTPSLTALVIKLEGCSMAKRNYGLLGDVPVPPPCLRGRVKEMSVEQYQGDRLQKTLLKWLLRGALVVESVRVVFKTGRRHSLMNEIKSWAQNPETRITFS